MRSPILPISNKPSHSLLGQPSPSTMASVASTRTMPLMGGEDDPTSRLPFSPSFEDDKASSQKPLLPRALNPTTTTSSSSYQQRRRQSFGRDVGHAAAETFLLTRLTLELLRFLGVGYKWITRFLALCCYALLLFPGFLQVGYYYFFSPQVRRSIVYGDQPRNRLDLYLPKNSEGLKPVIAFVTGGAWIIGYKAWGCLLGQQLSERDIIVACIDYRNFPQGTMSDMVKDASQGISFVCNNIAEFGGDPDRIYLMGQSAGAHIGACTILDQAIKEAGEGESTSWSVSQIKAYFGLSGGKSFAETLLKVGVKAECILYEGKTHTDLFLQDPMRGGRDQMFEDLVAIIHAGDAEALHRDEAAPPNKRLVPEFMLQWARRVSPF
ncbi:isoprenylcysteine alpha-carbonyl methylesterase ICME-like isoform X3 [Carya illinoinensis]|uniref:BD-FAE-like domain-containing protein n=1 Tax=Carya illinoinensis TaxID=32201 RepID=A0A922EU24_CARIL|nr:isoprenylcysteine alpha-carbonyl methylesterase ICME-like isoform X3 [Carya illinoinensis]KAG6708790.1 hypothetical protein I3842_06G099300 [Carya illinoinensis]